MRACGQELFLFAVQDVDVRKSAVRDGSRKKLRLSAQGTLMMYKYAFDHSKRRHVFLLNLE